MRDDAQSPALYLALAALLLTVVAGGIVDLILDDPSTLYSWHVAFEVTLVALSLGTAIYLWRAWHRATRALVSSHTDLEQASRDRDLWRARAETFLRGLGEEIDQQLRRWQLTPAERETALLLLKGLSHKQIASLSGKSERTVRHHSVAVYSKSGLGGRAELSAFFLEDLLLPQDMVREQTMSRDSSS